jgi:hypothetical protein
MEIRDTVKTKWFILGLIVIGGIAGAMLRHQKPAPQVVTAQPRPASPVPAPIIEPPVAVQEPPLAEPAKAPSVQPTPKPKSTAQTQAPLQNVKPGKEPLHDPNAREALAMVGIDPAAEQYWLDAIFDSSLPDNERADLMEDLNETGFADPKNLTANDLPLIMSRLQIINSVLPNADDFMADHLMEAQKDLVNMYARLAPQ